MKKLLFMLILISLVLCGCACELPLQQDSENIMKVELINENRKDDSCILTEDTVLQFINDLSQIECYKGLHPQGECGYLQIQITYQNGDMDIIGCKGNAQIIDGVFVMDGWYSFDEDDLLELFASYNESTP